MHTRTHARARAHTHTHTHTHTRAHTDIHRCIDACTRRFTLSTLARSVASGSAVRSLDLLKVREIRWTETRPADCVLTTSVVVQATQQTSVHHRLRHPDYSLFVDTRFVQLQQFRHDIPATTLSDQLWSHMKRIRTPLY